MMKDFTMHIIDITQNSVRADAKNVTVEIEEDIRKNIFSFKVIDDGKGMSDEFLKKVLDPFSTTRTTRKVGLGLPFLAQTCEMCGGRLELSSELGKGTTLTAIMCHDSIDRPPLGDIASAMHILIITNPEITFLYKHTYNDNSYMLDMSEVKRELDGVPLDEPSVVQWLKGELEEGINEMYQGA